MQRQNSQLVWTNCWFIRNVYECVMGCESFKGGFTLMKARKSHPSKLLWKATGTLVLRLKQNAPLDHLFCLLSFLQQFSQLKKTTTNCTHNKHTQEPLPTTSKCQWRLWIMTFFVFFNTIVLLHNAKLLRKSQDAACRVSNMRTSLRYKGGRKGGKKFSVLTNVL